MAQVSVVGGGLAGSECALQLASRGVDVVLFEQRPVHTTAAHRTDGLAELVCSNSLKSSRPDSAAGLLKEELALMGSQLLEVAHEAAVPAGGALAVDRDAFSQAVTARIASEPAITLVREEVSSIPSGPCVIAAGPLCSDALFKAVSGLVGGEAMSFFDAAAPIVDADTLDRSIVFEQSRYDEEGSGDYLNCPFSRDEYEAFHAALVSASRVIARDFEQGDLFCACQPAEEVARTGLDSLRFGAMKPVGLVDPRTGHRPWAAVQLRSENAARTAYNLVGFQTNLTWPEQRRVFRMIPGLSHAEFFRYGVMHRNSFVDAPRVLDHTFAVPGTQVRLAGQICGTEGYTEAIASGLLAALNTAAALDGRPAVSLPRTGALGSLVSYATDPATSPYQPMHVNFGLVPPLEGPRLKKRERYQAYADRARRDLMGYLEGRPDLGIDLT
ncbi:MAG: methylenetetrahydrofolate--tRNA-(uracil(54)-C(5))-methyltransferase (FADH(2)-oxidizing) TrmFO [Atopobiaceae bacterium]|jgi:methylenetetrahydrofolate--tRNA-(uracil-5-)-methyltransferase|nr:methylenetetrahydrofolate--tRNA-(uracil(54)-C(5))-methyltransferase (FADH(2)-oxidizing) TrmFO [Atopobiaceae bacterium]MCH4180041.1 methylenetetrahydrofolate--tRNA-(uracil(54)-C(5))-methyltransferase (FADH(2)-oxidizing) TrmFO [Atopobiaceae bacterium]MCH4213907.1 methylenetetrahydrofolate--tRNA-(uracil(54)-C(5))-methyltransferase (FADH(2)-oxidizing) TrmFO [Atopobiaceae bacterium]MCH4229843.1 methylenetetrahydrofolate--tRNA-(uracil(54)-C(5))-methyltransferase (FADH(2)-oxidizing) TrmFO [Atopobiac